ncbi:MAG TPA: polyphenol oxidase family protein [Solirubrobacterales bacterium]|nr:polyphenol oxidase family protein [Solirubrobacterales bacterium]
MEWRESNGIRWLQADLDGASAAFSTRLGGVSAPPYDTLNLGLLTADDGEAVGENRRRLAAALGFAPEQVAFARQVHGTRLLEQPRGGGVVEEADGHVLREAGTAALVFTADCLPVAIAGPKGMAMLHAGWRGLAGGILAAGAEAVAATSAAIGPGIGPCCYEVGDEVLESFAPLGEGVAKGRMLDLAEVARRQLAAAGVARVESAGLCTSCEAELFFSHRRDEGCTGRQGGVGWVEAG